MVDKAAARLGRKGGKARAENLKDKPGELHRIAMLGVARKKELRKQREEQQLKESQK